MKGSDRMPAGRPRTVDIKDLIEKLNIYIEESNDPMVVEFCGNYGISKDTIYRYAKESTELTDSIKRLHGKQEKRTVKLAEAGEIPTAWAIFKMKQKQYGWTDKQEIVSENTNKNVNMEVDSVEEADRIIKAYEKKKGGK